MTARTRPLPKGERSPAGGVALREWFHDAQGREAHEAEAVGVIVTELDSRGQRISETRLVLRPN